VVLSAGMDRHFQPEATLGRLLASTMWL
jgi:hypothetical protein